MSVITNGDARALAAQLSNELRGEFNIGDPKSALITLKQNASDRRIVEVLYEGIVRFFNG